MSSQFSQFSQVFSVLSVLSGLLRSSQVFSVLTVCLTVLTVCLAVWHKVLLSAHTVSSLVYAVCTHTRLYLDTAHITHIRYSKVFACMHIMHSLQQGICLCVCYLSAMRVGLCSNYIPSSYLSERVIFWYFHGQIGPLIEKHWVPIHMPVPFSQVIIVTVRV